MKLTKIMAASRRLPTSYDNMPARYVKRHTTFLIKRAPRLPQYTEKIFRYKYRPYYDQWKPWEREFDKLNSPQVKIMPVFVEPLRDCPYLRGDRVEVIRGPDKGKQGIIKSIVKERNWVFVEGCNLRREFIEKNKQDSSVGMIVCREEPLLMNLEVQLVDPSDLMPTTVEWRYDDDGNRIRISTRTERELPIPELAYSTIDYKERDKYKEQEKDTPAKEVEKITFNPSKAVTFEMDICEEMGIKDDRVPYPMYWY